MFVSINIPYCLYNVYKQSNFLTNWWQRKKEKTPSWVGKSTPGRPQIGKSWFGVWPFLFDLFSKMGLCKDCVCCYCFSSTRVFIVLYMFVKNNNVIICVFSFVVVQTARQCELPLLLSLEECYHPIVDRFTWQPTFKDISVLQVNPNPYIFPCFLFFCS